MRAHNIAQLPHKAHKAAIAIALLAALAAGLAVAPPAWAADSGAIAAGTPASGVGTQAAGAIELTGDMVTLDSDSFVFTGFERKPKVTVTVNDATLTAEQDYTVKFVDEDFTAEADAAKRLVYPGEKKVVVKGTGGYTGEVSVAYKIIPLDLSTCTIDEIPDQVYTGKEVEPSLTVKTAEGEELISPDIYQPEYADNTNVSTEEKKATVTVHPKDGDIEKKGYVKGTQDASFTIAKLDLSQLTAENVTVPAQTFTGALLQPSIVVKTEAGTEVSDSLYTYTFADGVEGAKNAGTYKLTIVPKEGNDAVIGEFSGVTFEVKPLDLSNSNCTIAVDGTTSLQYTGKAIQPKVTVEYKGNKLSNDGKTTGGPETVEPTAYTVTYPSDCTNVGAKSITIRPAPGQEGNFVNGTTGSCTFSITAESIGSATIADIPDQPYTGKAITPNPTITFNGVRLTKDKDYTLSYVNNVRAAGEKQASVYITGKGNFSTISSVLKTFTILDRQLSNATLSAIASQTYTSKAITPAVTVTLAGKTLKKGTDYTVSYANNTNVGTATVTVKGKGEYLGTKSTTFSIVGRPISGATVAAIPTQVYTGDSIMPALTVKVGGTTLRNGVDYAALFSKNVNPGTASVAIVGLNTYTGTKMASFKIASNSTPKLTAVRNGSGSVILYWTPVYGAKKYWVGEKQPNGKYRTLKANCKATSGAVYNLSATRKHRFLVRAYVNGKWSSNADKHLVSIKPSGATKPSVRITSASKTSLQLAWDSVPGASRYALYEKVGGSFVMLTNSYKGTTLQMTKLSKNKSYTYYVRACVEGTWSKVAKSDYVTMSPADPNPPTVKAVNSKVGKGAVRLSWAKVRGASKYWVQCKQGNGSWKTLTKSLKKTTYTASKLNTSKTYTFRVRAYGNKKWSKVYSVYDVAAKPSTT